MVPSRYQTTDSPFTLDGADISSKVGAIENLFETGYSTLDLTSNAESAGFQLALWEILYEETGAYDLDGGSVSKGTFFQTRTANSNPTQKQLLIDTENFANSLLAGLGGPITQNYDLTFLQSVPEPGGTRSQNLVTVTAVPLPAAGWMLLAGLGGIAAMRRRRI